MNSSDYPPLPFMPTPLECRKWANRHPLATCEADRDILSYIAFLQSIDKAGEGGAYVRYKAIAEKVKRDQRTVKRRIKRFVELGVILKETRSWEKCEQPNRPCIFTVHQEGVTDHLEETGTVTVTAEASDGREYEKEVEREYIKGGSDTQRESVTPPCHYEGNLTPPGVTETPQSVTGGVTTTGGGECQSVTPYTSIATSFSDLSTSDIPLEYISDMNTGSDAGTPKRSIAARSDDTWWTILQNPLTNEPIRETSTTSDNERIHFVDGDSMEYSAVKLARKLNASSTGRLVKAIEYATDNPARYERHCKTRESFDDYLSGLVL